MTAHQFSLSDLGEVLVQHAGLPKETPALDPASTFSDVDLDSLAFLQLQTELQGRFGFELPDDRAQEYTFGEIVDYVNNQLSTAGAA